MALNQKEREWLKMASEKWQDKYISGPDGIFLVGTVYWRGEGWLEAIVHPVHPDQISTMKLSDMKLHYKIIPRPTVL